MSLKIWLPLCGNAQVRQQNRYGGINPQNCVWGHGPDNGYSTALIGGSVEYQVGYANWNNMTGFTMSFWIYIDQIASTQRAIMGIPNPGNTGTSNGNNFLVIIPANTSNLYISFFGNKSTGTSYTYQLETKKWYHICLTYKNPTNGSNNGEYKFFLNNIVKDEATGITTVRTMDTSRANWNIVATHCFISDVRFYDTYFGYDDVFMLYYCNVNQASVETPSKKTFKIKHKNDNYQHLRMNKEDFWVKSNQEDDIKKVCEWVKNLQELRLEFDSDDRATVYFSKPPADVANILHSGSVTVRLQWLEQKLIFSGPGNKRNLNIVSHCGARKHYITLNNVDAPHGGRVARFSRPYATENPQAPGFHKMFITLNSQNITDGYVTYTTTGWHNSGHFHMSSNATANLDLSDENFYHINAVEMYVPALGKGTTDLFQYERQGYRKFSNTAYSPNYVERHPQ